MRPQKRRIPRYATRTPQKVRRVGSKFSYRYIIDAATAELAKAILQGHVERFHAWQLAAPNRLDLPLPRRFAAWWMQQGPTAFTTWEDNRLFREDLYQRVSSMYTQPMDD